MGREAAQVGWGGETWAGAGREEKGGSGRPRRREKVGEGRKKRKRSRTFGRGPRGREEDFGPKGKED